MISSNLFGGSRNELGPYRATRIWNDIVRTFRAGMPIGRRRRQLRIYEDVFVAADAVAWLHEYLQQNHDSGPEITRPQTVLLLQKFQRCGVIEDVRGEKSNSEPFEENNRLFHFTRLSPKKSPTRRQPFSSCTNLPAMAAAEESLANTKQMTFFGSMPLPLNGLQVIDAREQAAMSWESRDDVLQQPQPPKAQVVAVPLLAASGGTNYHREPHMVDRSSSSDDQWKATTLDCLKKALLLRSVTEVPVDASAVYGSHIRHNAMQPCRNGTVLAPSRANGTATTSTSDSLPGWLAMAMRCLARWPEKTDDDLPKYPGFEKDVFAMVRDYFESQSEPLTTFALYNVITHAWVRTSATAAADASDSGGSSGGSSFSGSDCPPSGTLNSTPLLPRRLAASRGSNGRAPATLTFGGVRTLSTPNLSCLPEQNLGIQKMATAAPGPSRADVAVHCAGTSVALPPNYEPDHSLYYTPPCSGPRRLPVERVHSDLATRQCELGSQQTLQRVPSLRDLAPLDFYSLEWVHARVASAGGNSTLASVAGGVSPSLQFVAGSMPNLAWRGEVGSDCMRRCSDPAGILAVPPSHRSAASAERSPGDCGYGSTESVRAGAAARMAKRLSRPPLKKFASVLDVSDGGTNLASSSQRFYSASDVNCASAFLEGSLCNRAAADKHCGESERAEAERLSSHIQVSPGCDGSHQPSAAVECAESVPVPAPYQPVLSGAAVRWRRSTATSASSVPREAHCSSQEVRIVSHTAPVMAGARILSTTQPVASVLPSGIRQSFSGECAAIGTCVLSAMMRVRLVKSLQLCLMLLPPASRHQLQVLLRLLHRLLHNECLQLASLSTSPVTQSQFAASTSEIVLQAFWRSILRSRFEADLNEVLAMNIVRFLIDNNEQIMIVPPDLMKSMEFNQVRRRGKVSMIQQPPPQSSKCNELKSTRCAEQARPLTFCEQVTKEEYEKQRMSVSERALTELLDNIVKDTKMTTKEKKKKLKQFEKAYPEIYIWRFPTPESQPSFMIERPKIKQPLLAKPLRLLRSLR